MQEWKLKKKKKENLITDLYGKTEYVIHIRNLKQALNHGLVLKEIHKIIKFKQNYTYKIIHMNTKLRKKAKNDFEKNFFKLMNNSVFGKTMKFMVKQSKVWYFKLWVRKATTNRKEEKSCYLN